MQQALTLQMTSEAYKLALMEDAVEVDCEPEQQCAGLVVGQQEALLSNDPQVQSRWSQAVQKEPQREMALVVPFLPFGKSAWL